MKTLKNVVESLNSIVQSNVLYNTFGEGQVFEIDGEVDIEYPMIWVDCETNTHNILNSSVVFNIDIWFIDLVNDDEKNEINIKSDTMESAIDLVKFLKDNFNDLGFYVVDGQYVAQSFTEKWNDKVSGTKLTLPITIKGSGSSCKNIFTL